MRPRVASLSSGFFRSDVVYEPQDFRKLPIAYSPFSGCPRQAHPKKQIGNQEETTIGTEPIDTATAAPRRAQGKP
jgi:hypothetical protein